MIKNVLKVLAVVISLCGIGIGVYAYRSQNAPVSSEVDSFKEVNVRLGDIKISFDADGKAYLPVIKLDFPISGQLKDVMFEIGDNIKKGDIIAKLEDKDYINKLESAQINYQQAVVKLEKTKQQYELALISEKSKLDNLKYQHDSLSLQYLPMEQIPDAYPRQELESKRAAYENSKAAYTSALQAYNLLVEGSKDIELDEISIKQAEAAVKTAEDNLTDTILKSPVDGNILSIAYNPGEMVSSSGDSTYLAVVSDVEGLEVTALVSELDVAKTEKDQKVEMEFEASQGQTFTGKVLSIDPLPVTDSSGIVSYTVNIGIDNASDKILDGMTCIVSFILKEKKNVIVIPNTAVKVIERKQIVEVKEKSGEIVAKVIKTGLTDGSDVEVIGGLEVGEVVIVRTKK